MTFDIADRQIAPSAIQEWFFDRANGDFELDLAESGVQYQLVADLPVEKHWDLDYSVDRGLPGLRAAIADVYGITTASHDVVVTHGAQEALYVFYRTLLDPGDHVVVTTPGWQQAWEVPHFIGCDVTKLHREPGTTFDVDSLRNLLTDRTKLLVLNSPGNPSGTAVGDKEWDDLIQLAEERNLWIVNDEDYLLDYRKSVVSRYARGVSASSLSKVYGMPALRVGWAVAPPEIAERMLNYKRYITMTNSSVWERVAERVLLDQNKHIARYRDLVQPGLRLLQEFAARHAEHLELVPPEGTPFAWLRLSGDRDSKVVAEHALDEEKLLIAPGELFGSKNALRITFARPPELLTEALDRLSRVVSNPE